MQLIYENQHGEKIDLLNDPDFILTAATGLSSLPQNNISTIETVVVDGDTVTNRKRSSRQVVLTHTLQHNVKAARLKFAQTLDQGAKGKLRYSDERVNVYLDVEVETCEVANTEFPVTITTTLIANFPYWLDDEVQSVGNKAITGGWQFPFTFPVTFGVMNTGGSVLIENNGDFDFGFIARLTFKGNVKKPFVQNHEGKKITVDWGALEFIEGQALEISTMTGDLRADLLEVDEDENITSRLNFLGYVPLDSEFFKIMHGDNLISAGAEEGAQNIDLTIDFRAARKVV